ncbi:hypothetical protein VE03_08231 [Pseudogymnoascus sp. 23342-1-I1]|nr:hypothetical protein VE03_08231 [Pseudogymnoascus sp. 23342-1-I1]
MADEVILRVEAQPASYRLALSSEGVEEKFCFSISDLTVFPPVGCVFCGVLFES